jgi:hypothetical protein
MPAALGAYHACGRIEQTTTAPHDLSNIIMPLAYVLAVHRARVGFAVSPASVVHGFCDCRMIRATLGAAVDSTGLGAASAASACTALTRTWKPWLLAWDWAHLCRLARVRQLAAAGRVSARAPQDLGMNKARPETLGETADLLMSAWLACIDERRAPRR